MCRFELHSRARPPEFLRAARAGWGRNLRAAVLTSPSRISTVFTTMFLLRWPSDTDLVSRLVSVGVRRGGLRWALGALDILGHPWLPATPNQAGRAEALPKGLATPKSPLCWASPGYSVHCWLSWPGCVSDPR